ncbi:MAG: hypothetical protein EGR80_02540 [Ruminiclostridium sp.]|nr:hypothetical protein [Ruminiclostridium sp.]
MAEYYNKFYKHPQNEYDPKYFMIPPKECLHCICYYCFNKLCPHCVGYRYSLAVDMCVKDKKIRSKDMIPHRCDKCYYLWNKKKPIYDCDFFVNFRRKITLYTLIRKYRKKSALEILVERVESLEKKIDELYNDINRK